MTIRQKTFIIVGTNFLVLLLSIYLIFTTILHSSYSDLEKINTQQNAIFLMNTLLQDMSDMALLIKDWANWDETKGFVENKNTCYIQNNLHNTVFKKYRLNLISITDSAGVPVTTKLFDTETEKELPLPNQFSSSIKSNSALLRKTPFDRVNQGIISLPEGLIYIVSMSIRNNEKQGPAQGTILFGRYLNSAEIQRLSQKSGFLLTAYPIDSNNLPADFQRMKRKLKPSDSITMESLTLNYGEGFALFNDCTGNPVLITRMENPKNIFAYVQITIHNLYFYSILSVVIIVLTMGTILLVFLEKNILTRLLQLREYIHNIRLKDDLSSRLILPGNDELANLASEFNRLLESVEQSHLTVKEKQRELSTLMSNLPGMAYRCRNDRNRTMEFVSEGCFELTGYQPDDLTGENQLPFSQIIHSDYRQLIAEKIFSALSSNQPFEAMYRIVTAQNEERWVWERGRSISPSVIEGFITGISTRKQIEEAQEQKIFNLIEPPGEISSLKFQDLFDLEEIQKIQDAFAEATGVASVITDVEGHPITVPSNFCRLCKDIIRKTEKGLANCMRSDAVLGRLHPEGPIVQPCLSGGFLGGGASICVGEYHIANWLIGQVLDDRASDEHLLKYAEEIGADPSAFQSALKEVSRMPKEQFEKVCKALFIIASQLSTLALQNVQQAREITRRKHKEENQRKIEAQILQTQKLESLGVLAGGIAHDFNNLLMVILGNADLALMKLPPASPVRHNILDIEKSSRRAADLCKQMLAYSGKGKFIIGPVNLSEIIQGMIEMLKVSISKKASISCNLDSNLPFIEADTAQMRQVVINLITNASESIGDQNGTITLSTGEQYCDSNYLTEPYFEENLPEGSYAYIEVKDSGSGMVEETKAKIYDPFFSTKFTGRGLGLPAVLGIVRGHKGIIKVDSVPGYGCTFKVLFPVIKTPAKESSAPSAESRAWGGTGTILIADDDESVRNVGKEMLEMAGFRILTASDGREAIDMYRAHQEEIVCILLDLTMPNMDGEETFRELLLIRPDIRVILCSGYNVQELSERFAGKGLAGFIQKPFQYTGLISILRTIFEEK